MLDLIRISKNIHTAKISAWSEQVSIFQMVDLIEDFTWEDV